MSDASDLDTSSVSWDPFNPNNSDDPNEISEGSDWENVLDYSNISCDPEGMAPIVDDESEFYYVNPDVPEDREREALW